MNPVELNVFIHELCVCTFLLDSKTFNFRSFVHVQAVHEGSGGSWDAEEVRVCVPEGTGQGAGGR